jgi:hypothetical protein
MSFNQEHFNYRCEVVRVNRRVGNQPRTKTTHAFSDIQEAYIWIQQNANIQIPQDQNVSEVGNYECLSFRFTTDILNMNVRREGFEFGVIPLTSDTRYYTIYYIPDEEQEQEQTQEQEEEQD